MRIACVRENLKAPRGAARGVEGVVYYSRAPYFVLEHILFVLLLSSAASTQRDAWYILSFIVEKRFKT